MAFGKGLLGMQEDLADGRHDLATLALLGVVEQHVNQVAGAVAQLREGSQGSLAECRGGLPGGPIEEIGDGLTRAIAAVEIAEALDAAPAVETGDGTDGTPEMHEVAAADQFAGLPKK